MTSHFRISVCLVLIVSLSACAGSQKEKGEDKKDPILERDSRECHSLSNLDGMGRGGPQAYRAQALFNKCMKDRGWPGR